ncbi:MAG: hypothetical protein HY736_02860 [Verrucomicrobia bacterium]|nr:hypothetical protein [Verrucomicrobiota bacterium]
MKTYKYCQSCGMPTKRDKQGGGTDADGGRSLLAGDLRPRSSAPSNYRLQAGSYNWQPGVPTPQSDESILTRALEPVSRIQLDSSLRSE